MVIAVRFFKKFLKNFEKSIDFVPDIGYNVNSERDKIPEKKG